MKRLLALLLGAWLPLSCFAAQAENAGLSVNRGGNALAFPIVGVGANHEAATDQPPAGEETDKAAETNAEANGDDKYRVYVCDRNGNPIEGALVQLCDDTTCSFQPTGADGAAVFAVNEQRAYEVHLLGVPEGYPLDTNTYHTLAVYSDVHIVLDKAE